MSCSIAGAFLATFVLQAAPAVAKESGGIAATQLDASKPLPSGVKAEGAKVEQVWSWSERDGASGLAVFSSTEARSGERLTDRRLYVQLFRIEAGQPKQLRLVKDFVNGCEYDLTAQFLPGSVTVTDKDSDGTPVALGPHRSTGTEPPRSKAPPLGALTGWPRQRATRARRGRGVWGGEGVERARHSRIRLGVRRSSARILSTAFGRWSTISSEENLRNLMPWLSR